MRFLLRVQRLTEPGKLIHGEDWRLLWMGPVTIAPEALQTQVQGYLDAVDTQLAADFPDAARPTRSRRMLFLLVSEGLTVRQMLRRVLPIVRVTPDPGLAAAYVPAWRTIAVASHPAATDFGAALIHEATHAVVHARLGAPQSAPWAAEGYAHDIERRLTTNPHAPTDDLLRLVSAAIEADSAIPLTDLLAMRQLPTDAHMHALFRAQAALLVAFLRDRRAKSPELWRALFAALTDSGSKSPTSLVANEPAWRAFVRSGAIPTA